MADDITRDLNEELAKLAVLVARSHSKVSMERFIETMMGGGLADIVENNGGKILSFMVINDDGEEVSLHDFHIPDLGGMYNLRGFFMSANDGSQTLKGAELNTVQQFSEELNTFFEGLYVTILSVLEAGNAVSVRLKDAATPS